MKMILFLAFVALGHTPTAPHVMPNANVVFVNEMADDCPRSNPPMAAILIGGWCQVMQTSGDACLIWRRTLSRSRPWPIGYANSGLRCLSHMSGRREQYFLMRFGTRPNAKKTFRFGKTSIFSIGCLSSKTNRSRFK